MNDIHTISGTGIWGLDPTKQSNLYNNWQSRSFPPDQPLNGIKSIMDYRFSIISLYHKVKDKLHIDHKHMVINLLMSELQEDMVLAEEILKTFQVSHFKQ